MAKRHHITFELGLKNCWVFPRPKAEKNKKCFFDLEAYQLTFGHKTSLEKVWHFSPLQKNACLSNYYHLYKLSLIINSNKLSLIC